jgi:L-methionine (R)-S-oxide reductase
MMPDYELLERQARELVAGERDHVANAANFAAFFFREIPDVSWAGFYYADEGGDLVLGPFAGKPACTRLPKGEGVCGAALTSSSTIVVDDVNAFPGHIVCDNDARSEIVVPLLDGGRPYGVFDVDSALLGRFSDQDRGGIERLVHAFCAAVKPLSTTR